MNTNKGGIVKNIVKFEYFDTRTGDHTYSGWHEGYYVCDGENHYKVEFGQGVFLDQTITKEGQCDGSCEEGERVNPLFLPAWLQEGMGIFERVPEGMKRRPGTLNDLALAAAVVDADLAAEILHAMPEDDPNETDLWRSRLAAYTSAAETLVRSPEPRYRASMVATPRKLLSAWWLPTPGD